MLVAQRGKILLEKDFGIKNGLEGTLNIQTESQYYPITKSFTSTMISLLVEQQLLKNIKMTGRTYDILLDFRNPKTWLQHPNM